MCDAPASHFGQWNTPAGQTVAYLSPNVGTANGMVTLMLVIQTLTMGFLVYPQNIPYAMGGL